MKLLTALLMLAGLLLLPRPLASGPRSLRPGADRIGVAAPPLELQRWLNSPSQEMNALRGKVVLIRWWTDSCPLCVTTAPALRKLNQKYRDRGLVVIGVFHPKPPGDWSMARIRQSSERLGFTFPVALDGDWKTLHRWWLDSQPRDWTSVSFLVDKKGVIRYVQPGGEFHEEGQATHDLLDHAACVRDYKEIEKTIVQLLAEQ